MRILHCISTVNPQDGGPVRVVKGLIGTLNQEGVDVMLFSHSSEYEIENQVENLFRKGRGHKQSIAQKDLLETINEFKPDIIHLHGVWVPVIHFDSVLAFRKKIPIVLSPHGALSPWALKQKRIKKMLALWVYQKRDLQRVSAFHVTSEFEKLHVRRLGLNQPVGIVHNGVDLPEELNSNRPSDQLLKTALFLSRLHPGKGLLPLADAWAELKPVGWRMKVVGPDCYGHKDEVVERLNQLGILPDWEFIDMVDDAEKWDIYASSDLFIHPSMSENFGISIAEALYAKLPVLTTQGAPWKDIETYNCGWWIPPGDQVALVSSLRKAFNLSPEERNEMGLRGQQLILEHYSWPLAGKRMIRFYEDILKTLSKS